MSHVCVCSVQRWFMCVCVCTIVHNVAAPVQKGHSLEVQRGRRERRGSRAAVSEVQVGGGRGGGGGARNPVNKAINWRDKAHMWLDEQPWKQETVQLFKPSSDPPPLLQKVFALTRQREKERERRRIRAKPACWVTKSRLGKKTKKTAEFSTRGVSCLLRL